MKRSLGEIKKGRYVYYHCTGYKGKCPEPYTREEVFEEQFTDILKKLVFDDEVIGWVSEALRQSHKDEKRFHDEAIARLQAEYTRYQNRIDAMYIDKLDGRIDAAFFDRRSAEWRTQQEQILRSIEEHQTANQTYLDEGVMLIELARRAPDLFEKQAPSEKRRLLDFVLSNCVWREGKLTPTFRQPFDMLAVATDDHKKRKAAGDHSNSRFDNWLLR